MVKHFFEGEDMKAFFNNGDLLRDNVTGLEGIVMVVAHYSSGCIHYGLQTQKTKDDGTLADWTWLDQSRFSSVKGGAVKFNFDLERRTSGPMPCGPQR